MSSPFIPPPRIKTPPVNVEKRYDDKVSLRKQILELQVVLNSMALFSGGILAIAGLTGDYQNMILSLPIMALWCIGNSTQQEMHRMFRDLSSPVEESAV